MRKKPFVWIGAGAAAVAIAAAALLLHHWRPGSLRIQGAVIRKDADVRKQLPISDVVVTASDGSRKVETRSDASGYFRVFLPGAVWPGRTATLTFQHPEYEPLKMTIDAGLRQAGKEIYVAAMTAEPEHTAGNGEAQSIVSNIRVRYTMNSHSEENIGSAVRTFQVANRGNAACDRQPPCSPDGNWKAAIGSFSLDAGIGNEFRNVRASCIAGPCPFTRIDFSRFVNGGRYVSISALDWSDTATFLLEAEVFHVGIRSSVRELYPVVFGRALTFTLPPTQEGVSIEADVDGAPMVFPLGPDLYLSWATCASSSNGVDGALSTVYRCELKPGYRFQFSGIDNALDR